MSNPRGIFKRRLLFILLQFFSSLLPSISPKVHMSIHLPSFGDLALLQSDLLSIIFDTIAILSISPYRIDFVGIITPLPEPITLVGMGHGTPISIIGVVQWILHTGYTSLTIHDQCYRVPNVRTFLMSPQRLFGTRGGATGTFTIDDKCATLSLDGKPYLQIPYNSNSYLPVALARNYNASSSPIEFNMSVLSNENTNLNPS